MSKLKVLVLMMAAILIAAAITSCDKAKEEPTEIAFIFDINEALKAAAESDQPLIAEFFKPDCPWCRMFDDSTFNNKTVISMAADMKFAKINAATDSATAAKYGVSFYPTIIVFRSSGAEIDRLVGYYPPADFFNEVQLYIQGNETLKDYHIRLADEPERMDYHLVLGEKYKYHSDWDKALEYYNNVLRLAGEDNTYELERATIGIADVYCERDEFRKAAEQYEDFLAKYPQSEKAEDAARKLPYCLAQDGQLDLAREYFTKYLDSYPGGIFAGWVREKIAELDRFLKAGK